MGQVRTKHRKSISPTYHVQWESDYDSTWEEEQERPRKKKKLKKQFHLCDSRAIAARDLQLYRHGYPQNQVEAKKQSSSSSSSSLNCFGDKTYEKKGPYCRVEMSNFTPNLDFYQNKEPFKPNGVYIEELLTNWKYDILEMNHSYIQWLFPLQEPGRNSSAKPLTIYEIQIMKKDQEVKRRFFAAYRLMLGFYGIKLQDCETGKVTRAKNWEERFHNLNNHSHNNLRITRILKCLGEMGFKHFQAPLVRFFLEETLCNNSLPNVEQSVLDYFMFTVKDKQERRKLVHFAWVNYKFQEPFIWGPVEKLQSYRNGTRTGSVVRSTSRKKVQKTNEIGKCYY